MTDENDLFARELRLRARAGQVMAELRMRGEDWQTWRTHPVAIEYRQLLKDAWQRKHRPGTDSRYQFKASK